MTTIDEEIITVLKKNMNGAQFEAVYQTIKDAADLKNQLALKTKSLDRYEAQVEDLKKEIEFYKSREKMITDRTNAIRSQEITLKNRELAVAEKEASIIKEILEDKIATDLGNRDAFLITREKELKKLQEGITEKYLELDRREMNLALRISEATLMAEQHKSQFAMDLMNSLARNPTFQKTVLTKENTPTKEGSFYCSRCSSSGYSPGNMMVPATEVTTTEKVE